MTGLLARISYFKRYRLEIALGSVSPPAFPSGYSLVPWSWELMEAHAEVLFSCFHQEIDSKVFPGLGDRDGCLALMGAIVRKKGFLPDATWLLVGPDGPCATVQGVCERPGLGGIQNLGVVPELRGLGLGRAMLMQALHGFAQARLRSVFLEVTAQNDAAIELYRSLGFRRTKTVYKVVGAED